MAGFEASILRLCVECSTAVLLQLAEAIGTSVACTINVYDRRFYDRKLCSSLERKLRLYDRKPT